MATVYVAHDCGAPTLVAMDADGDWLVCEEKRWTTDIRVLELR